jgi:hypothetical protein
MATATVPTTTINARTSITGALKRIPARRPIPAAARHAHTKVGPSEHPGATSLSVRKSALAPICKRRTVYDCSVHTTLKMVVPL